MALDRPERRNAFDNAGNAMRWMLTGEEFDAAEALRIGLVQEVVPAGQQLARAVAVAEQIAQYAAPLGVRTTLRSARSVWEHGQDEAAHRLVPDVVELLRTEDAAEGVRSFVERRDATFSGR